jgi:hypothetical protein
MKNSSYNIGNRTRDLTACSVVPQPTAPPHAPLFRYIDIYMNNTTLRFNSVFVHKNMGKTKEELCPYRGSLWYSRPANYYLIRLATSDHGYSIAMCSLSSIFWGINSEEQPG